MQLPEYSIVGIDTVIPNAKNPRKHTKDQIKKIADSISAFGFKVPLLIDSNRVVIAGHGRLEAAKSLGLEKVPVLIDSQMTEAQKKAYLIADNKLGMLSYWDDDLLQEAIADISADDLDLDLLGFTDKEMDAILFIERDQQEIDPDDHWVGMPAYHADDPCYAKVVVNFDSKEDVDAFFKAIGQGYTDKTKSIWYPYKERRDLKNKAWVDESKDGEAIDSADDTQPQ